MYKFFRPLNQLPGCRQFLFHGFSMSRCIFRDRDMVTGYETN